MGIKKYINYRNPISYTSSILKCLVNFCMNVYTVTHYTLNMNFNYKKISSNSYHFISMNNFPILLLLTELIVISQSNNLLLRLYLDPLLEIKQKLRNNLNFRNGRVHWKLLKMLLSRQE